MKRVAMVVMALWAVTMAGCNTVSGFGKDVEKAGEVIQRKSGS